MSESEVSSAYFPNLLSILNYIIDFFTVYLGKPQKKFGLFLVARPLRPYQPPSNLLAKYVLF